MDSTSSVDYPCLIGDNEEEEVRNYSLFLTLILNQNLLQSCFNFLNTLEEKTRVQNLNQILCYIQLSFFLPCKIKQHHSNLLYGNFSKEIEKDSLVRQYLNQINELFFKKTSPLSVNLPEILKEEYEKQFLNKLHSPNEDSEETFQKLVPYIYGPIYNQILPMFMRSDQYIEFFKGIYFVL